MTSRLSRRVLSSLTMVSALATASLANAQPIAQCTVTSSTSTPLARETFTIDVTTNNSGTATGFAPAVELFVPSGFEVEGAVAVVGESQLAVSVTTATSVGSNYANPATGESVTPPADTRLFFARAPLSSIAAGAPAATIRFTLRHTNAAIGSSVGFGATCLYAFGNDAFNDPGDDAPIRSDSPAIAGDETSVSETPSVVRISERATASNTCTGTDFPFDYVIELDIATGYTLQGETITDILPDAFRATSATFTIGSGVVSSLPLGSGGAISFQPASVVGAVGIDVAMTIRGHIPDLDRLGASVLDTSTLAPVMISNSSSMMGASFSGPTGTGALPGVVSTPAVVTGHALYRSVTALSTHIPGDSPMVAVSTCASTYYAFTNVVRTAVLGDGLTHLTTFPITFLASGSDPTTITLAPTSIAAGATLMDVHSVLVDQVYASTASVLGLDRIPITTNATGTSGSVILSNDANTELRIAGPLFTKSVVLVNGGPVSGTPEVHAGDVVTFRITANIVSGDQDEVRITDFLPEPLFDASEHALSFGSTLRYSTTGATAAPTVTRDVGENSLTFTWTDVDNLAPETFTIEIDATVTDEPFEDGLIFTNVIRGSANGTTLSASTSLLASIEAAAPRLAIYHAAIASNNPRSSVTGGTVPALPYSSTSLAQSFPFGVTDVDAGDDVTMRVVIENRGQQAAHNTTVRVDIPVGYEDLPIAFALTSATLGSGAGVAVVTTRAGNGRSFTVDIPAPIDAFSVGSGTNIVVLTYTATLGSVRAALDLDTTARLTQYTSQAVASPNFALLYPGTSEDGALVTTASITVASSIVVSTSTAAIQDTFRIRTVVTIPEGESSNVVLADTLSPGKLAVVTVPSAPGAAVLTGVSASGSTTALFTSSGGVVTLNLGSVTNATRDNGANDTVALEYDVVVLNALSVQNGDALGNSAQVTHTGGSSNVAQVAAVTVVEPALTFDFSTVNASAQADEVVTYRVIVAHEGASTAAAHDVKASFTFPTGLTPSTTHDVISGVAPAIAVSGQVLTLDWAALNLAQGATIDIRARVDSGVGIGVTLDTPGTLVWSSRAGDRRSSVSSFTATAIERDGSGAGPDDYVRIDNTLTPISAVGFDYTLTSGATAAPGSLLTYQARVQIPQGTAPSIAIQSLFPPGVVFIDATALTTAATVQCEGVACTLPTPVTSGATTTFTFTNVSNSDAMPATNEYLELTIRAAVLGDGSVPRGTTLVTQGRLGAVTLTASAVTLVEPTLDISAMASAATGDAADRITVSTQLLHTVASDADAHDVAVIWTLPMHVAGIATTYSEGTCPAPASATFSGRTVAIVFATLPRNTNCSFSFAAELDTDVVEGSMLGASATLAWTSQPGPAPSVAGERSYADAEGATISFSVPRASVAHAFASTDRVETADPKIAIGETATYFVDVTLPEGTSPSTTVSYAVPRGLKVTGVALDRTMFSGTVGSDPSGAVVSTSGETAVFSLGTVVTNGDNDNTNNRVRLVVSVQGTADSAATDGNAVATLAVDGGGRGSASASADLALSGLSFGFTASTTTPSAGQDVTFTIALSNSGDGPACDTRATVSAGSGFGVTSPATDTVDNDGDGATDESDESSILSGSTLAFAGGCVTGSHSFRFRATPNNGATGTPRTFTATLGSYRTLPSGGDLINPETDRIDTDGDGTTDGSGDAAISIAVTPSVPVIVFEKSALDVNGADVEPADTIRFTITVRNTGNGGATSVVVRDPLPTTNASFVSGTVVVTGSSAVPTVASDTLTLNIGTLGPSDNVQIVFDMVAADPLPAGSRIRNQATLDAANGYGGRVSDDPRTVALNDATIVSVAATADSDGDGVPNGDDLDPLDASVCQDADNDTCDDCSVTMRGDTANDGADADSDGLCNVGEDASGSDRADADSDDDGVLDGAEINWFDDADTDGLINALDPDSDNDGLFDGTEQQVSIKPDATDASRGVFVADADANFGTDPTLRDTDTGTVADGLEDLNLDGALGGGERDPRAAGDDVAPTDTDTDGLADATETIIGTNPNDADSDDDGVLDGAEPNSRADTDGDGLINALDVDSDDDGVFDGTELSVTMPHRDTLVARRGFVADANPDTRTSVLVADSDRGGVDDGDEDFDADGAVDISDGESDPTLRSDDVPPTDTDSDGLVDASERALGSNEHDPDIDDDGLLDGLESNAAHDTDGDGRINLLDPDSDNDGLADGTEAGVSVAPTGTDVPRGYFRADADSSTRTSGLVRDTDRGGVSDGDEDTNLDGSVNSGEGNPKDASDDVRPPTDADSDGLSDALEITLGSSSNDSDSDDDGVRDGDEWDLAFDIDNDDLPNVVDPDSDDDGIFDGTERGITVADSGTAPGVTTFVPDTDDSTRTNPLLADTDGGGVPDGIEDLNRNGARDDMETDPLSASDDIATRDADMDGILDVVEGVGDPDNDGMANRVDTDSDGDTILDATEAGDSDLMTAPVDSDGDRTADYLDLDSDADTILDAAEAGDALLTTDPTDADRDLTPDYRDLDSDADTILDAAEAGDALTATPAIDTDTDGTSDFRDLDSDADSISDADEAGDALTATAPVDTDSDGTPDVRDLDSDGDTRTDSSESGDSMLSTPPFDTDRDGAADFRDRDSDADGTDDATDNCLLTPNADQADVDRDGIGDACSNDTDGDGVPNNRDSCPTTSNRDQADMDGDGTGDVCDGDRDGDGLVNTSDNCPDRVNANQADADRDGTGDACDPDAIPMFRDVNGDGFDDALRVRGSGCAVRGSENATGTSRWMLAAAFGVLLAARGLRRRPRARARKHATTGASMVAIAMLALASVPASAQVVEPRDFSVERFRLSLDRNGIVDAEWADTPGHLRFQFSSWVGYANNPFVVANQTGRVGALVRNRLAMGVVLSLGLGDFAQIGAELPFVLYQGRNPDVPGIVAPLGPLAQVGGGDARLAIKVRFLNAADHGIDLAIIPAVTIPMGSPGDYMRERTVLFAPELALSRATGAFRLAANLGYRFRPETSRVADLVVDDELYAIIGAGLRLAELSDGPPLELDATLALSTSGTAPFANQNQGSVEGKVGATVDFSRCFSIFGAFGFGLAPGFGTPDWRALGGIRIGEIGGARDSDSDGVNDSVDSCPNEPEDLDQFEDTNGCPDPDNDNDGVLDASDAAPLQPEDRDGFQDTDGAPDPDNDGDSVLDANDECPLEPGTPGAHGCPNRDADGDGVLLPDDQCPELAEDRDGFRDLDGCPDPDNDNDGVLDPDDVCPLVAGTQGTRGCPDRDGDGVGDNVDNCPDERGTEANHGCAVRQLVIIRQFRLEILDKVYFRTNSAEILRRSNALLNNVAQVILAHPEITRVRIEGHTDSRGDDNANLALSQRRADSVMEYLRRRSVPAERLRARGYGETRPVQAGESSEALAANRRVEFNIEDASSVESGNDPTGGSD